MSSQLGGLVSVSVQGCGDTGRGAAASAHRGPGRGSVLLSHRLLPVRANRRKPVACFGRWDQSENIVHTGASAGSQEGRTVA